MFWGIFLSFKKWSFFEHFGKMPCVAPGYSQMTCFNIALESALNKLQNSPKKLNFWKPLEICDDGVLQIPRPNYDRHF
jgi:hypothetical protein